MPQNDKRLDRLFYLSILFMVTICVLGVWTSKFYSSDGAMYLFELMRLEELYSFQEGRLFAHYIMKFPAYLAIKMGAYNFDVISALVGIPMYLQSIVCLIVSRWFLKDKEKWLILFPILNIFICSLNTEYAIESEALTLVSFFWPVFFFIFSGIKFGLNIKSFVFLIFTLTVPLTYETFAICSLPLVYLIFKNKLLNIKLKSTLISYYSVMSLYQFYNIIYHQHPQNVGGMIKSIYPGMFGITQYGFSKYNFFNVHLGWMIFLLFLFTFFLIRKKERMHFSILPALTVISGVVFSYVIFHPEIMTRTTQFQTRALTSISPILFSFLIAIVVKLNRLEKLRSMTSFVLLFLVLQFSMSMFTTYHWIQFKDFLKSASFGQEGVFPISRELVNQKSKYRIFVRNYMPWSLPLYSIFLKDDKKINSIAVPPYKHEATNGILLDITRKRFLSKYGFEIDNRIK